MTRSIKKIDAENADILQRVLGTVDENLNVLMHELDVIIRVDGVEVVVTGSEDKTAQAVSVLENLLALAANGESVDKARTQY